MPRRAGLPRAKIAHLRVWSRAGSQRGGCVLLAVVLKARMDELVDGLLPLGRTPQVLAIELALLVRLVLPIIVAMLHELGDGELPIAPVGEVAHVDGLVAELVLGHGLLIGGWREQIGRPVRESMQIGDDQRQALNLELLYDELLQLLVGDAEAANDGDGGEFVALFQQRVVVEWCRGGEEASAQTLQRS